MIRSLNRASPIRKFPVRGAAAPAIEDSCVSATVRRTTCAFLETFSYSAPSIPPRNPWSGASSSSNPIPGPERALPTSALAPPPPPWLPSAGAAALSPLKPPWLSMPRPRGASVWLGRQSRPGRKECNDRRLFYHLRRSLIKRACKVRQSGTIPR